LVLNNDELEKVGNFENNDALGFYFFTALSAIIELQQQQLKFL
jgi:hypothetical protein